jgi:YjbE family integral membrane protein
VVRFEDTAIVIPLALSTFLLSLGSVILVDLILSGDNALIIGTIASRIPQHRQRWLALAFGGVVAILLRIILTIAATFLLRIPFLQSAGGILVFLIAARFILDDQPSSPSDTAATLSQSTETQPEELPPLARKFSTWMNRKMQSRLTTSQRNFLIAVATITVADLTMSLDNIIAIGALARGQVFIIAVGLILSIVLLLLGSALISELVGHIPGLIFLTRCMLAWTAADLLWNDLHSFVIYAVNVGLHLLFIGSIIVIYALQWFRSRPTKTTIQAPQKKGSPIYSSNSYAQTGDVTQVPQKKPIDV